MRSLLLGLSALLSAVHVCIANQDPLHGIYGIVQRRIPEHVHDFTFKLTKESGDQFEISDTKSHRGGIIISCSTVSACARGLYTYVDAIFKAGAY